jgi:hypothetical protein
VFATSLQVVHFNSMKSRTELVTSGADAASQQKPRYIPKPKGSWMKLFGRAKNDDLSPDAYRLGAEWRERMNREGR